MGKNKWEIDYPKRLDSSNSRVAKDMTGSNRPNTAYISNCTRRLTVQNPKAKMKSPKPNHNTESQKPRPSGWNPQKKLKNSWSFLFP